MYALPTSISQSCHHPVLAFLLPGWFHGSSLLGSDTVAQDAMPDERKAVNAADAYINACAGTRVEAVGSGF